MSTPSLTNVDLTALTSDVPALSGVDLTAPGAPPSFSGTGSATLDFAASGTGASPFTGLGSVTLSFSGAGQASHGFLGSGAAGFNITASGSGFQDWLSKLESVRLQEVYRLVITGTADSLADLHIGGISSWQATNQASGRDSYVQAVIPNAGQYISDIEARQNGDLVIEKGYRLEDGSVRYEEILRSRFDNLIPDRGRQSVTLTVSGYLQGKAAPSASRTLTGIRSINARNGKRRVRCNIDMFLQPQMTVTALDESFIVGYINYYVNSADKFCEVGER